MGYALRSNIEFEPTCYAVEPKASKKSIQTRLEFGGLEALFQIIKCPENEVVLEHMGVTKKDLGKWLTNYEQRVGCDIMNECFSTFSDDEYLITVCALTKGGLKPLFEQASPLKKLYDSNKINTTMVSCILQKAE